MSAKQAQKLNLPGIEPVDMREIRHRNKRSVIRDSNAFKNAMAIIKHVKEHGISPFEGYTVLNMERIKSTDPEMAKMKTTFLSFVTNLKEAVKESGVDKELEVVARGNNRVYLGAIND